jgi:hypothetical protein
MLSDLQSKLLASYPFFASQHSYGYALSQENGYLTQQLFFSNFSKIEQ